MGLHVGPRGHFLGRIAAIGVLYPFVIKLNVVIGTKSLKEGNRIEEYVPMVRMIDIRNRMGILIHVVRMVLNSRFVIRNSRVKD